MNKLIRDLYTKWLKYRLRRKLAKIGKEYEKQEEEEIPNSLRGDPDKLS